jgi:hypothetical protein
MQVEKNEEGLFRKWLAQTDEMVEQWQNPDKRFLDFLKDPPTTDGESSAETPVKVHSCLYSTQLYQSSSLGARDNATVNDSM